MAQLLLAGLSLFQDGSLWDVHGALGFALVIPIAAVVTIAFRHPHRAALRGPALLVALAYAAQVALILTGEALGSGLLQALHVANAGLVLAASLSLARLTTQAGTQPS